MKINKAIGIAVFLIGIVLLAGCAAQTGPGGTAPAGEVIKIGFISPLSGDVASYGIGAKKGMELAKKELGMDNIQVIVEDSKCEGKEAVTAVNKLILVDGVKAIIGELCSGATLAAAPIAEQNNVVLISPASTSPKVTDAGDYIFRVIPSDALQGDFGANLAYDKGHRKLAVLYSNEEYGLGFNTVLTESFEGLGGDVVASETFERGAADLRTQVTKIKNAGPDAIYIISNSLDSAVAVLQQIEELGVDAALFASEGLKSPDVTAGAGAAAEGMLVSSVSSGTTDFVASHMVEYGEEPGPFAVQAYDAFTAVAMVIQQGATTGEEIKNALYALDFEGKSGHIVFDENGDVFGNYDLYEVMDGAFVLVNQ